MLQGNSRFYVEILARTTTGGLLCYIFLPEDKSLAFKFDKGSREVMIDKFNVKSKNSFQFELLVAMAEEFSDVKFVKNC